MTDKKTEKKINIVETNNNEKRLYKKNRKHNYDYSSKEILCRKTILLKMSQVF